MIDADNMPLQVCALGCRCVHWVRLGRGVMETILFKSAVVNNMHLPPSRQDPSLLFEHPLYITSGNLFWPDAWEGKVKDAAYSMHGLIPEAARVSTDPRGSKGEY